MINVDREKCTGCGICEKACPFGAIIIVDKIAVIGDDCALCGACVDQCNVGAIIIHRKKIEEVDLLKYQDVWIVAEIKDDNIRNVSFELLGKAIELADHLGQFALQAVILPAFDDLANYVCKLGVCFPFPLIESALKFLLQIDPSSVRVESGTEKGRS